MSEKTAKEGKHVCVVCQKNFSCRGNLDRHMACHDGSVHLECSTCNKIFHRKDMFKLHMQTHTGERPHVCETCGKGFFRRQKLTRHMLIHGTAKPFSCEICGKRSIDRYDLKKHIFIHVKKGYSVEAINSAIENMHVTKTAPKGKSPKKVTVDEKVLEKIEPKMTCIVCGKKFRQYYKLVVHMQTHIQERPYVCGICAKQYFEKSKLKSHMLTHTARKRLTCKFCSITTMEAATMRMHLLRHQDKGYDAESIEAAIDELKKERSVFSDELKPFSCEICAQTSSDPYEMRTHILRHTGKGPTAVSIKSALGALERQRSGIEGAAFRALTNSAKSHIKTSTIQSEGLSNSISTNDTNNDVEHVNKVNGNSSEMRVNKIHKSKEKQDKVGEVAVKDCCVYLRRLSSSKQSSSTGDGTASNIKEKGDNCNQAHSFPPFISDTKSNACIKRANRFGGQYNETVEANKSSEYSDENETEVGDTETSTDEVRTALNSKEAVKDCYVRVRRLSLSKLGECSKQYIEATDNVRENSGCSDGAEQSDDDAEEIQKMFEDVNTAICSLNSPSTDSHISESDIFIETKDTTQLRAANKNLVSYERSDTVQCVHNREEKQENSVQCVHHKEKVQESVGNSSIVTETNRKRHVDSTEETSATMGGWLNFCLNTAQDCTDLDGENAEGTVALDTPDVSDKAEYPEKTVLTAEQELSITSEMDNHTDEGSSNTDVPLLKQLSDEEDNVSERYFAIAKDLDNPEERNGGNRASEERNGGNQALEERNDGNQAPEKMHRKKKKKKACRYSDPNLGRMKTLRTRSLQSSGVYNVDDAEEDEEFRDNDINVKKKKREYWGQHKCHVCGKGFCFTTGLQRHRAAMLEKKHIKHTSTYDKKELLALEEIIKSRREARQTKDEDIIKRPKKVYECNACGLRCQAFDHLRRHRAAMLEKKHIKHTSTYDEKELLALEEIIKSRKEARQNKGEDIIKRPKKDYECNACGRRCHGCAHLRNHRAAMLLKGDEKHTSTYDENEIITLNEVILKQREAKQKNNSSVKPTKNHVCDICGKTFRKLSQIKIHLKTHSSEKPALCTVCGKSFWYETSLYKHLKKHDEDFPYQCEKCGEIFRSEDGMQSHVKNSICDKITYQTDSVPCSEEAISSEIDNLVIGPADAKYECTICSRRLQTKAYLLCHLQFHKMKTKRKSKAKAAMENNEGESEDSSQEEKDRKKLGKRQYECEECGDVLLSRGSLRNHMLLHTNEKPYSCKVCSKTFRTQIKAKYHVRIHLAKKTVPCPVCRRLFRNKRSMKEHEYKHTREKPVKCKICSKMLKHEYLLPKHMRFVHRISHYL